MANEDHRVAVIKELGIFAQKTLLTLNAGAIIVLLTFIGNLEDNDLVRFDLPSLKSAAFAFLAGIALTFGSIATTYAHAQIVVAGGRTWFDRSLTTFPMVMMGLPTLAAVAFITEAAFALNGVQAQ